jgi:hypothetical protein
MAHAQAGAARASAKALMHRVLNLHVEGETCIGDDVVLLDREDDLIVKTSWKNEGYSVEKFLALPDFAALEAGIRRMVWTLVREAGVSVSDNEPLVNYHKIVQGNDEAHRFVARWGMPLSLFPINPDLVCDRISEICQTPLRLKSVPNKEGVSEVPFGFRVVRPRSTDQNPLHRDAWQDVWKGTLNIWIPIAGCNEKTSLPLVPGSHRWMESEIERTRSGARIDNKVYMVPSVTGSARDLTPIIPNPGPNEVLVFSPYVIHGNASNKTEDTSRVSIEMRFERRP